MKWKDGTIDGAQILKPPKHQDARGWLCEIFRSDELSPGLIPTMAYLSITRPGVARGPHEHREQTDIFGFIGQGSFEVRLWDNRVVSPTFGCKMVVVTDPSIPVVMVIPPGVVHGYRNVSAVDAMVLNMPNRLYAGKNRKSAVDEIRYEESSTAPFSMT